MVGNDGDIWMTGITNGSCLCGAVKFEISGALRPALACHCTQCRRISGHYWAATAAKRDAVRVISDDDLSWYASSTQARRGFCRICGSTLFWDHSDRDSLSISCGALSEPAQFRIASHIFTADKGSYYDIGDGLPLHAGDLPQHDETMRPRRRREPGRSGINFSAIDVETANRDCASICQIGVVEVRDGKIADCWRTLVDPREDFDEMNIRIHGIDQSTVSGSPVLPDLQTELEARLNGSFLVSHTNFDRRALDRAMRLHGAEPLQAHWLDSVKIARRAWPGRSTYKLGALAEQLGVVFRHHDALEDARVVVDIVLKACEACGYSMLDWQDVCLRRSSKTARSNWRRY